MTMGALNYSARFSTRFLGHEKNPLVTIDNVLRAPDELIALACKANFDSPPGGYYPGINAPLPKDYASSLVKALRPLLAQNFGFPLDAPIQLSGYLALATLNPSQLKPIQKIPHYDSTDPMQLAMVHYLCRGSQGGTGFYRHIDTGFETIDPERSPVYLSSYHRALATYGDRLQRHVCAETPGYELIDKEDALLNRLIIYRSNCLHSGDLENSNLSSDPRTGRLTANIFIKCL